MYNGFRVYRESFIVFYLCACRYFGEKVSIHFYESTIGDLFSVYIYLTVNLGISF